MSKVLVVDDSSTLRRVVREALSVFEFDIQEAENGIKALECLEESTFDLIILDWVMPEMDGFEMFTKLQSIEKLKMIPVIMLTAENNKDMVLKAIRSGVKHYLTKPFTREELLARVLKVLNLDQNTQ
jgi:two-component system, chemotaxis family, chemotaxis protein CheY